MDRVSCEACGAIGTHQRGCPIAPASGQGVGLKNKAKAPNHTGERDIERALRKRYLRETNGSTAKWAFIGQVSVKTTGPSRRLDGFAFNCWQSGRGERHAFEIKVSRADLRHELANPEKRAPGMALSTHFYFVTPKSLNLDGIDLPKDCGLITVDEKGARISQRAPRRDTPEPPYEFMLSCLRTAQKQPR